MQKKHMKIFYCVLFFTLTSVKIWYTYFFMTFLLFFGTWIGQIIYSARKGTKPPMPYLYIFFVTLFKMIIPIYLKCYSNSIFSFRPNYLKVFALSFPISLMSNNISINIFSACSHKISFSKIFLT